MGWPETLIKTLAIVITPVKLVDKGIDYTKQEVKDAMDKIKILGAMAFILFMFTVFISVSIALVINYFSETNFMGFLIVSAGYFLIAIILFMVYQKNQN